MDLIEDIIWEGPDDRLALSPSQGGRVVAWSHRGSDNLVREPQQLEGGLLRTILAEERYPGSSYCTPHLVLPRQAPDGLFRVRLRHYWHAPNVAARLLGWPEKRCPRYLDGLLLDKVVTFDPPRSALLVELSIGNLSGARRRLTPWVQNTFCEWIDHGFVVRDARREDYRPSGDWWAMHRADGAGAIRLVQSNPDETLFAVLGADPGPLAGVLKYDPADFGPGAREAIAELRYRPLDLADGECWRANYFVAVTEDWRAWASQSPAELHHHIEKSAARWRDEDLAPALAAWALPEERSRGAMVFSFLDKLPFTSEGRYKPAHAIAGFHAGRAGASAALALIALRDLRGVCCELSAGAGWRLIDEGAQAASRGPQSRGRGSKPVASGLETCIGLGVPRFDLRRLELRKLTIQAPRDLRGKGDVSLRIAGPEGEIAVLRVPADVAVEKRYPYQFKQMATYLDERFRAEKQGFTGSTAAELRAWQKRLRRRYVRWMRDSVIGDCPLEPRLLERQTGQSCVRDKVAIQTEPGMWIPAYVVYPRKPPARMPVIVLIHGSGPGKQAFVPDELELSRIRPEPGHELIAMPYALARGMNCLVYVPDQRSQGEWGETYSTAAAQRVGYNPWAMRMWDHVRSLDYLCSRPDVDAARIGCMGASGGGSATMYTAGVDERVTAAILSSMPPYRVAGPDQFFQDPWSDGRLDDGWAPLTTTPSPTVDVCALNIPRPLWIMDGTHDECWGDAKAPDAEAVFAKARAKWQLARDEIARLYTLAGAADRLKMSWFPGPHCAGMTVDNAVGWFSKWLKI